MNEGETSAIEEIPPADLDRHLNSLYQFEKKSGEEYEPTALRGFIASAHVDRHLKKFRY